MDRLKMAVAKIVAQKPNLLLVENSVSRYAQDLLIEKNISLVLNIKKPLMQRIARCTGAQIVPSVDLLPSQKLGYCELFHVDKYYEHSITPVNMAKKMLKTMMFLEGCPKPLGCTVSDKLFYSSSGIGGH
jgi:1-phosphatidylinositol-3-phosphate 5-kinase